MYKVVFYIEYIVMMIVLNLLTWNNDNRWIRYIPFYYLILKSVWITYSYKHKLPPYD